MQIAKLVPELLLPESSGRCSLTNVTRLMPIGSIITVEAVLLIHMLKPAVASMNPAIRRVGCVPAPRTVSSAMRRCKFHFSTARAIMNPPRKRKMNLFAYGGAAWLRSKTPVNGKRISGRSDVTGSGTASVIHQTAISTAMAAVAWAGFTPIDTS